LKISYTVFQVHSLRGCKRQAKKGRRNDGYKPERSTEPLTPVVASWARWHTR
jgi:hypothetical protein